MKKIFFSIIVFTTLCLNTFAQSPEGFSYQAVVRDGMGVIIANQAVGMQMTIYQTSAMGTMVYQETFSPTTNDFGLVNLSIGSGTVVSGTFASIDWGAGPYFIETAIDPAGGSAYVVMGASQLLSVPYALYAASAGNVDDADADPANELNSTVVLNGTDLEVTDAGGTITTSLATLQDGVTDADADPANELNSTVVLNGTDLEVTDAGGTLSANLSSLVDDADADPTNEHNTSVVLNGTDLEVTDGGGTLTADLSSLGGGASNWTLTGTDISNNNTGRVGIKTGTTPGSYTLSVTDTLAAVGVGNIGAFNNVNSGKVFFSEDVAFTGGDCGIGFSYNGATNIMYLAGACTGPDTMASFTRNGQSRIDQLRVGDPLTNATNPLSVTGNSDISGNLTIGGNLTVTGSISKGSGTFKIDHPLDPANKYLVHSFVESPEMMNVYSGNITTDANGFATVSLPAYFEVANKDFRYQLTVMGSFAQAIIKEKVKNNSFVIQTNTPNVEVSWQVTGVRADKFADKNRVIPELEKEYKGTYLHPELYGASKDNSETAHTERLRKEAMEKEASTTLDADQ